VEPVSNTNTDEVVRAYVRLSYIRIPNGTCMKIKNKNKILPSPHFFKKKMMGNKKFCIRCLTRRRDVSLSRYSMIYIHCLIHADDTVILSTDRNLFIKKCELAFSYFAKNKLPLIMSKTRYMVINGTNIPKCDLHI
jgi:hypothetical protein